MSIMLDDLIALRKKANRQFASPQATTDNSAAAGLAGTSGAATIAASPRDKILQQKYGAEPAGNTAAPSVMPYNPATSTATRQNMPYNPATSTATAQPMSATSTGTPAATPPAGTVPLRDLLQQAGLTVNWNAASPGTATVVGPGSKTTTVDLTQGKNVGGTTYVTPDVITNIKNTLGVGGATGGTATEVLDKGKREGNNVKSFIEDNTGKVVGYVGWDDKQYNMDGTPFTGGLASGVYPTGGTPSDVAGGIAADYAKLQSDVKSVADSYFANQQSYIKQLSDAGVAMMKLYNDRFSQAVALLQSQINRDPTIPESLKLALAEVREGVKENGNVLLEQMNARGILRSGITAVELEKLAEMGSKQEQKMLAQWLDNENANMMQAVQSLANLYAQSAAPAAQMLYTATTAPIQAGMELGKQAFQVDTDFAQKAFDISTGLRKWTYEQDQAAKAAEAAAEQARADLEFRTWQALLPYQYMTAAQQAQAAQEWARMDETQRHNKIMEAISQAARAQTADWQQYMRDRNTNADAIDRNTIIAIEGIMDPTVVWDENSLSAYLANQVPIWTSTDPNIARPVNFSDILNAIKYRFPNSASDDLLNALRGLGGKND